MLPRFESLRYAIIGALFGLCFPLGSLAFLYATQHPPADDGLLRWIGAAHAHHGLLYVIDTAPLFLGLFAGFAGLRQDRLNAINQSLEDEVAHKTASLRAALAQAEKVNQLICHAAEHDPLTGLLNRHRLQREIDSALAYARRYARQGALMFIDLDRFKEVNDSHGHDAGDRYLKEFAALLERLVRITDRIGRWGGDEFLVLLPETDLRGAQQLGERLIAQLATSRFDLGAATIEPGCSIGVAAYPSAAARTEDLLACADRAMYEAKRAGGQRVGLCAPGQDKRQAPAASP